MLEVTYNGNIASIDLRERILNGEHPRAEIVDFVKHANRGTIVEVHLPYAAPPLVSALESVGFNAIVNELAPDHYRLMCVVI
ncbi:MAG: amino acid decarboxylase [Paenibacillaceae bacterium]